MKSPAI